MINISSRNGERSKNDSIFIQQKYNKLKKRRKFLHLNIYISQMKKKKRNKIGSNSNPLSESFNTYALHRGDYSGSFKGKH